MAKDLKRALLLAVNVSPPTPLPAEPPPLPAVPPPAVRTEPPTSKTGAIPGSEDPTFSDSSEESESEDTEPFIYNSIFSLYKELAIRIKQALKSSSRKEVIKIDMPFDQLEFDGGLKLREA